VASSLVILVASQLPLTSLVCDEFSSRSTSEHNTCNSQS